MNRTIFVFLVLMLVFIQNVKPAEEFEGGFGEGETKPEDRPPSDWSSSDYASADYSKIPEDNWPQVDQSQIPPSRIKDIPPAKVDITKVQDPSKLTLEQVNAHKDDLVWVDADKLSPDVRDKVIGGYTQNNGVKTETSAGTKLEDKGDHIEINQLDKFTSDKMSFTDAKEIKIYKNGCWQIEEASIIDFFGVSNAEVNNFDGCNDKKYSIKKADSVRAGCFDARDVRDAEVEINGELTLTTKKNTAFDIYYGFRNIMDYISTEANNQLVFDPGSCAIPFYQIRGVNLTISLPKAKEHIEAQNSAGITLSREFGVDCIDFIPTGSYSYTPLDMRAAFGLRVGQVNHKTCIRKDVKQSFRDCEQCTNVDLVDKRITINGQVEYRRLHYNEELNPLNVLSPGLVTKYITTTPAKAELVLDEQFLNVRRLDSLSPLADDTVVVTNWLTFKDYRDQRDAFVAVSVTDYSEPLLDIFTAPAFPKIEVGKEVVDSGQYHFYFPESNASISFFQQLLQRHDLNFP